MQEAVTRFAPSPTGHLHLGHAFSALFAEAEARRQNGRFILRIEDIDPVRCRPEFVETIFEDLRWLGVTWEEPVLQQSHNLPAYATALDRLREMEVLYPCFCTRKEIAEEAAASGHAPHGPEGVIYPGTCRHLSHTERAEKLAHSKTANWRLDMAQAHKIAGTMLWHDRACGMVEAKPEQFGDVVLARKDVAASYHLCVTIDDHAQGVTLVTRGEDLFPATDIHRLLQSLLGLHTPDYHHHPLMKDESGRRYTKRDKSLTLRTLRAEGITAGEIHHDLLRFAQQIQLLAKK